MILKSIVSYGVMIKFMQTTQRKRFAHMKLSQRIREQREDRDLTQKDIAIFLNTSQTVYSRYERNERTLPTEMLFELARYYNISADYLLGLTDEPRRLK